MSKKLVPKKRGENPDKLTAQQQMFIEAYFTCCKFNAAQAALKVGYTNAQSGRQLLNNKKIRAVIGKRMNDMMNDYHSEADRIVLELENIAFANPQDILRPDGSVTPLQDLPQRTARSISRMKVSYVDGGIDANGNAITATNVDISYYDKLTALEMLMRYRGMYDSVNQEAKQNVDWDSMSAPHDNPDAFLEEDDSIEQRILSYEPEEEVKEE
jgi:hypothetical protein